MLVTLGLPAKSQRLSPTNPPYWISIIDLHVTVSHILSIVCWVQVLPHDHQLMDGVFVGCLESTSIGEIDGVSASKLTRSVHISVLPKLVQGLVMTLATLMAE